MHKSDVLKFDIDKIKYFFVKEVNVNHGMNYMLDNYYYYCVIVMMLHIALFLPVWMF